ncbi:MAG TPA: hypothetical protein VKV04_02215 [Verrucomicrobiae bacterium]|nr:hypothetical protein [Verrucomicrobiae bacterium]
MNLLTGHALPLPKGRILRFARCHTYTVTGANELAHIRASRYANLPASLSASSTASLAANLAGSLTLRYL